MGQDFSEICSDYMTSTVGVSGVFFVWSCLRWKKKHLLLICLHHFFWCWHRSPGSLFSRISFYKKTTHSQLIRKWIPWANKMAQRMKTLATKTDDMNSISGFHMVKGGDWLLQIVFWPSHMSHMTRVHPPHHHTHNK